MIEKLTNHIVDCQIASGKIKEEEGSVYRYGYTLFFEKLINIAIALIICLITGKWLAVGLFLLAVIPFRSFAGGWHAKEFWQCAILSNLMIVIMLICIEKLCITKEIVYVIFLFLHEVGHYNQFENMGRKVEEFINKDLALYEENFKKVEELQSRRRERIYKGSDCSLTYKERSELEKYMKEYREISKEKEAQCIELLDHHFLFFLFGDHSKEHSSKTRKH